MITPPSEKRLGIGHVESEQTQISKGESAPSSLALIAIRTGIVAGFFACLAYPLAVFVPLPKLATTTLVACFGPALGIASYGLRRLRVFPAP